MAFVDFNQPAAGPTGPVFAARSPISAPSPAALSSAAPSPIARSPAALRMLDYVMPPADAEPAGFARTEWQIVALARADGLASLRAPGRIARLRALLFGAATSRRLASDRLEALRRLAVEAWHRGYAVSLSTLAAFRAAGFSTAQLELLLATISAGRSARGRRSYT